jgi:hypothetical protein
MAQAEIAGWAAVSVFIILVGIYFSWDDFFFFLSWLTPFNTSCTWLIIFCEKFYITSAIASARLVKKSMLFASGTQWVDQRSESRDDLKEPINPSCSKDSNSAVLTSSTLGKPSRNCASNLQRLQRSYCQ